MLKKWEKISSKVVSKNKFWSYILEEFEIDGNHRGEYHYVHTGGSTMIIPVTDSGNILLVNQYRYLNKKESLEFPCGSIQENISKEENALKELREESGYSSKDLKYIGEFSPYSGVSDEMCYVFTADELFHSPLKADFTEDFELHELTFEEVERMIEEGEIWDGMSICSWTIAKKEILKMLKK